MIEYGQDIIVTAVALGAVGLIGRRLVGAVRPQKSAQSACPHCASGAAACAKPAADTHTLTLVRPGTPR